MSDTVVVWRQWSSPRVREASRAAPRQCDRSYTEQEKIQILNEGGSQTSLPFPATGFIGDDMQPLTKERRRCCYSLRRRARVAETRKGGTCKTCKASKTKVNQDLPEYKGRITDCVLCLHDTLAPPGAAADQYSEIITRDDEYIDSIPHRSPYGGSCFSDVDAEASDGTDLPFIGERLHGPG